MIDHDGWLTQILGEIVGALLPQPRRITSRIGVVLLVLAGLAAFFLPVSAVAGTETVTLRYLTTGALALAGVACIAAHGRLALFAAGLVILVVGGFAAHAPWLFWVAGGSIAAFGISYGIESVRSRQAAPPRVPDTPDDDESATDVVESIATAFVLALIVREFAFEAFKIPTGSMEPTIYGEGWGKQRSGDRLLAAKVPLLFCEPQRWSILVFKYPLFRPTNYIKRLVGLSGEHLQNRRGDIYVNGKVVSKPEEVQETLWFPIAPNESGEWQGGLGNSFASDGAGEWTFDSDGATGRSLTDKTGWITHATGFPDVRASFDLDPSGLGPDGAVLVRLDGDGRRVELEARRDGMWLTSPGSGGDGGAGKQKLDVEGLGSSRCRLGFAVADRVVRVYRDGRLVARVETADESNVATPSEEVGFGVSGGSARLSKIKLEHDLQYSMQGSADWQIPEGCYFMLGDNTNSSKDSRLWRGSVFRFVDGRPELVADDSVRLDDEHQITNIRTVGEAYEFYDSYGVKRHVEKSDLVGGAPTQESQPFVRREDLVGRAFLIFWPLKPDWRPRILP